MSSYLFYFDTFKWLSSAVANIIRSILVGMRKFFEFLKVLNSFDRQLKRMNSSEG